MLEFKMTTDLTTEMPAVIGFNFDELKAGLAERLEHYKTLVVTEDTIKEGKADRAKLNKLREAIDTRRKDVKKQILAPYKGFEDKVKELTALIDEPIAAIDSQLQAYEDRRREERQKEIDKAYLTIVPEHLRDIIPMQIIFSPKWLNATTTMKSVEEDLTARVQRTSADMLVLDTVEPEYAAAVREVYIRTLDISKAIAHKEALKSAADAFAAREAAKAALEAEKATAPAREPERAPVEQPAPVAEPEPAPAATEKLYALRLELHVTMDQANALKRFLHESGIEYIKI